MTESLVAHFQPIYGIHEERVVGFETLARLRRGDALLMPAQFLPSLDAASSLRLFHAMLVQGIAFLKEMHRSPAADLYITFNVNASLLMQRDFVELIRFTLACHEVSPARLLVEILEGEAIADPAAMIGAIGELKALGLTVALDDVGSAYASLVHIKDLPIDVLKLDQEFSRQLAWRPEDLQFISSMLGLSRGLDRKLIVEGVETAEILDAVAILGVEYVQGYAIARPMPAVEAIAWLRSASLPRLCDEPTTMLGVYAAHLTIVEACRVLADQPLKLRWDEGAADPHCCKIGRYFDRQGLHDTSIGRAHERFHRSLTLDDQGNRAWRAAAEDLRRHLLAALRQQREDGAGYVAVAAS